MKNYWFTLLFACTLLFKFDIAVCMAMHPDRYANEGVKVNTETEAAIRDIGSSGTSRVPEVLPRTALTLQEETDMEVCREKSKREEDLVLPSTLTHAESRSEVTSETSNLDFRTITDSL